MKDLIFAITLTYNRFRIAFLGWHYYDKIVDKIYLGAIPLKSNWEEISPIARWFVSAIEPCERAKGLIYTPAVPDEKQRCDVPMVDFGGKMDIHCIDCAVEFMRKHKDEGVYVHCKAGRARSATILCCYLLKYEPTLYDPNDPVDSVIACLKSKRKQIDLNDAKVETIHEYYATHCV